jgi:signal transduction histidine kinase
MQLESVAPQLAEPARGRLHAAVNDLDETIREIRGTIYALSHDDVGETTSLRVRVLETVDAAARVLGFTPGLRLTGLVDTRVPSGVADHVVSVLREALSNVGRHAQARRADVELDVDDELVLRVADDGLGLPEGGRRSGLDNLAQRAEALGGSFSAARRPAGGTELLWRVPLPKR